MDPAEARRLLGVGPDAGPDAVHRAYRTRARSAHPDVGGSRDEMAQINEAQRVLRGAVGSADDPDDPDDPDEWSDDPGSGSVSAALRRSLIVLVGLCAVVVVVVFVAAVGYDWSVGTP